MFIDSIKIHINFVYFCNLFNFVILFVKFVVLRTYFDGNSSVVFGFFTQSMRESLCFKKWCLHIFGKNVIWFVNITPKENMFRDFVISSTSSGFLFFQPRCTDDLPSSERCYRRPVARKLRSRRSDADCPTETSSRGTLSESHEATR